MHSMSPSPRTLASAVIVLVAATLCMQHPKLKSLPAALLPQHIKTSNLTTQDSTVDGRVWRSYHPAFGIYPRGCKWRVVSVTSKVASNQQSEHVEYEFWDVEQRTWTSMMPASCSPSGFDAATAPNGWDFHQGTPRSEMVCDKDACHYHNLYYNNGRWYALVDGDSHTPSWRISRNQEVIPLHYTSARSFLNTVNWRVIPGNTILFDFIYYTHPTAIGHWWEMLGPMYSTLKRAGIKRPCDQFVLLHLERQHVFEWVRAMIAVTLGVGVDADLPPVYMQQPTADAWSRLSSLIEGFDRGTWYIFEKVAITKDLATGGGRTFFSSEDAREFRSLVYQHYGLPPPSPRMSLPRLITYQRKRANRRIINEGELIKLLSQYGQLEVVEYNSTSSLHEQLLQMQRTGVFVAAHTSNLANAPLLQPGSAVVELIQKNWHWNGLDTSFRDQTAMMGDIHHFAWRCHYRNQTQYLNPRDEAKVAHWPPSECGTEECVEAHTRVDIKVDIAELKALLDDRLPCVFEGKAVHSCRIPWPPVRDVPEDSVIPL